MVTVTRQRERQRSGGFGNTMRNSSSFLMCVHVCVFQLSQEPTGVFQLLVFVLF